jgi:ribose 5-phosphate isomerase B
VPAGTAVNPDRLAGPDSLCAMRVHLGSDHAGLKLKEHLISWLVENGHEPVDHGPFVYDAVDDYPVFCLRAAMGAADDQGSLGVVIGGSGNGEQIAANKVKGVRAALAWSEETAVLARQHNDANVVSVGGRMHSLEDMTRFVQLFLETPFSEEERHTRRIGMLTDYENSGNLPPLPDSAVRPQDSDA